MAMEGEEERIRRIMKLVVWDYNVDPYELYRIVTGARDGIGHFDAERVLIRMLERLSWYDLLDLLGVDRLREGLKPGTVGKIRFRELRERYERVRKVLQGEAVPPTGWDPEYRKQIRNTLLSDRWYRAEPGMVRA